MIKKLLNGVSSVVIGVFVGASLGVGIEQVCEAIGINPLYVCGIFLVAVMYQLDKLIKFRDEIMEEDNND